MDLCETKMREGESFVQGLPRLTRFYDRSKFWAYELARLTAAKLIDNPSLIEDGRVFIDRHIRPDPHQAIYFKMWLDILGKDVREISRLILEDSPHGEWLRDTMPIFYVPTPEERQSAMSRSYNSDEIEITVAGPRR
jgi:hypothetical protein